MKKSLLFILATFIAFGCQQNEEEIIKPTETVDNETIFDSIRATNDGADDYGMRKYVLAFLKKGPNRSQDSTTAAKLQMAHMENIGKMAEAGKLVLAGPFFGDGYLRGIYIFAVESVDEAKKLTETDPAIIAGSLEMELIEWYGSAALMEVNEIHKRISKIEI